MTDETKELVQKLRERGNRLLEIAKKNPDKRPSPGFDAEFLGIYYLVAAEKIEKSDANE